MTRTLGSISGAVFASLFLLTACSGAEDAAETGEGSEMSSASYAATAQTRAELGVASWVLHHTKDSSVLEAEDATGAVTERASLRWTETAEGRIVDITLAGSHVRWQERDADGAVAETGLDALRNNAAAVAFATHAASDLPPPPSVDVSPSALRPLDVRLVKDVPEAAPCMGTFDPAVQDCMKRMISIGLSQGLRPFCISRCLGGG